MSKISVILIVLFLSSCTKQEKNKAINNNEAVNNTIDNWHRAVANYDFNTYFSYMADDAVFIGTDASENWKGQAFKQFCKPYFDKKKTWNFTPLQRHVYFNKDKNTAWFDELLATNMGVCRGSGVLIYQNKDWKIKHYVLSLTIPNENMDSIKKFNKIHDIELINTLKKQ